MYINDMPITDAEAGCIHWNVIAMIQSLHMTLVHRLKRALVSPYSNAPPGHIIAPRYSITSRPVSGAVVLHLSKELGTGWPEPQIAPPPTHLSEPGPRTWRSRRRLPSLGLHTGGCQIRSVLAKMLLCCGTARRIASSSAALFHHKSLADGLQKMHTAMA
jgi:hypothetical protein